MSIWPKSAYRSHRDRTACQPATALAGTSPASGWIVPDNITILPLPPYAPE